MITIIITLITLRIIVIKGENKRSPRWKSNARLVHEAMNGRMMERLRVYGSVRSSQRNTGDRKCKKKKPPYSQSVAACQLYSHSHYYNVKCWNWSRSKQEKEARVEQGPTIRRRWEGSSPHRASIGFAWLARSQCNTAFETNKIIVHVHTVHSAWNRKTRDYCVWKRLDLNHRWLGNFSVDERTNEIVGELRAHLILIESERRVSARRAFNVNTLERRLSKVKPPPQQQTSIDRGWVA